MTTLDTLLMDLENLPPDAMPLVAANAFALYMDRAEGVGPAATAFLAAMVDQTTEDMGHRDELVAAIEDYSDD